MNLAGCKRKFDVARYIAQHPVVPLPAVDKGGAASAAAAKEEEAGAGASLSGGAAASGGAARPAKRMKTEH